MTYVKFLLKKVVEPYIIAIERWFELAKTEMAPKNGIQKQSPFSTTRLQISNCSSDPPTQKNSMQSMIDLAPNG